MSLHSKAQKLSYKSLFLIIVFLLAPIILLIQINKKANVVSAGWFDDKWGYRKAVSITNSVGTTLTDFQVSVSIGTSALINSGKMQSDCDDIRITDTNGKLLPHWIEENNPGCNAVTDTKVWVKVPNLPSSGGTVYVYYGNPSATNITDGNKVFEFFDDFNDGTINTSKWTTYINGGSVTESSSTLQIVGSGGWNVNGISSNNTYNKSSIGWVMFWRVKFTTTNIATMIGYSPKALAYWTGINHYVSSTATKWYRWRDNSGAEIGTFTNNTWYNIKTDLKNGNGYTLYKDDSILENDTTYTGNNYAMVMQQYNSGATSSFDYVYMTKYASTTPSSSLSSTEEVSKAPAAYWSFDEGVGTTVYDSSGHNYTGTFLSAPVWKTEDMCVSGKCLAFDNVDDGVSIANKNFAGLTDYTMSAWINLKGTHKNYTGAIMSSGNWNNDEWVFGIKQDNSAIDLYNTGSRYQNYAFQLNKWTHVAVTRSGAQYTFYVDGKSIGGWSGSSSALVSDATNTTIGRETYAGGYFAFNGWIDEPKIYPYARTAAEIKSDYAAGEAHAKSDKGSSVNLGSNSKSSDAFSDGLVGYWKMDEASSPYLDSSGNGYTGTWVNNGYSSGKFGIGVSLDGNNDYVNLGPNFNFTSESFSISHWIKLNSLFTATANVGPIPFYKGNYQVNGYYSGIGNSGDVIFVTNQSGAVQFSSTTINTISTGTWYYLTYVRNGSSVRIYVNGEDKTSTAASHINPTTSSSNFQIGKYSSNNIDMNGLMDEVRIYNRALSTTEVKQLYEWAPGPVAYYKFDEGVGTTAFDTSGNSNNGAWSGSGTHWDTGKFGKAGKFNGTSDCINGGNNNILDITNAITYEAWAKFQVDTDVQYVVENYHKAGIARVSSNTLQWFLSIGSTFNTVQTVNTVSKGTWHHIATTRDTTNGLLIYVDGIKQTTTTVAGSQNPTGNIDAGNPLYIGCYNANQLVMNGSLDEVKIYNYARTQKQIVEDMNAGHPNVGSPIASAIAHYKFDEGYGTVANNSGSAGSVLSGTFGAGNSAPTWTNNGKFGKALSVVAPQNTRINTNAALSYTQDGFTYSAWIRPSTLNAAYNMFMGQMLPYFDVYTNRLHMSMTAAGAQQQVWGNTQTITTNQWYHVAATYDSQGYMKVYLNGKLDGIAGPYLTPTNYGNNLYIGTWEPTGTYPFNGLIDDIKVYNYALTDDEIKVDYNRGAAIQLGTESSGAGNTAPATAGSQVYCVPGDTATCSPPVAEWLMDEGIGTSAYDTSGNNYPLSLSNTAWSKGKNGKSLSFSSNSSSSVLDNPSVSLTNTGTLEAWVYSNRAYPSDTGDDNYREIINKWTGGGCSGADEGYFLDWYGSNSSGNLRGLICNGTSNQGITASLSFIPKTWNHIAYVWDGSFHRLYLNGNSYGTPVSQTINNQDDTSTLWVGRGFGNNYPWDGSIDQVRIYNYARSPAQIAWDYNKGGPVAWYKFDECQGATVNSTNEIYTPSLSGTISIGPSGPQTSLGTCSIGSTASAWSNGSTGNPSTGSGSSLNFDGNDDYVLSNTTLTASSNMSLSVWVKRSGNGTGTFPGIISYGYGDQAGNPRMLLFTSSNKPAIFVEGTSIGSNNISTYTLPLNEWVHIVATYSGTQQIIYINGIANSTFNENVGNLSGSKYIQIGENDYDLGVNHLFQGQIDEVQIFNYALTDTQVKTLYSGGAVNFR